MKYKDHDCLYCGMALKPKKWVGKRIYYELRKRFNERKFCDNVCRSRQLSIDGAGEGNYFYGKSFAPWNKRKESYWEWTDNSGYVRANKRVGDKVVVKLKHRAVVEEDIGRELSTEEHVHHIDFDKTNNSIENLMIVSNSEHTKIHWAYSQNNKLENV